MFSFYKLILYVRVPVILSVFPTCVTSIHMTHDTPVKIDCPKYGITFSYITGVIISLLKCSRFLDATCFCQIAIKVTEKKGTLSLLRTSHTQVI